ncbi:MAG: TrmH family RNA methyltransferase, partial [Candidatus Dormiibacterota bacterium]
LPDRAVFVAGGETAGLTSQVRALVDSWVSIPMTPGVESLNVATAVAILGYELRRRQLTSNASA